MNYNERRIKEYREKAIALLKKVKREGDAEDFNDAAITLSHLQTYLDMPSPQYPVRQDIYPI